VASPKTVNRSPTPFTGGLFFLKQIQDKASTYIQLSAQAANINVMLVTLLFW